MLLNFYDILDAFLKLHLLIYLYVLVGGCECMGVPVTAHKWRPLTTIRWVLEIKRIRFGDKFLYIAEPSPGTIFVIKLRGQEAS